MYKLKALVLFRKTAFFIVFTAAWCVFGAVNSQQNVSVILVNKQGFESSPQDINLSAYYQDNFEKAGFNVEVKNTKIWRVKVSGARPGLYNLSVHRQLSFDLILYPGMEDSVLIELDERDVRFGSNEQAAFGILKTIMAEKTQAVERYNEKRITISMVDPMYYHKKEQLKYELDSIKEHYNTLLRDTLAGYRTSFVYRYMLPFVSIPTRMGFKNGYEIYDNHHAYYHRHMFDGIDMSDDVILNTPLFKNILNDYLGNFFGEFTDDYRQGTDYLMTRATNPAVRDYVLNKIVIALYAKNEYELIKEIYNRYYDGCVDAVDNQAIKDILEFPLLVNSRLTDLILYREADQQQVYLSQVVTDKPNILLFWREDCSHCRETLTIMSSQKEKYRDYSIITVLLSEKGSMPPAAIQLPDEWTRLYCGDQLKNVLSALRIRKTPFFIRLNKALIIDKFYSSYESIRF